MEPGTSSQKPAYSQRGIMSNVLAALSAAAHCAFWSQRGRWGQTIPVAISLLLLIGTLQGIAALHDVSSTLTRQQIARNWRSSYDLLVRPQQAVSQPERAAGWINPQSMLDSYGGMTGNQIAAIQALPGVEDAAPFANAGWQSVDVKVPLSFAQAGLYRITANWRISGEAANQGSVFTRYVDITSLTELSNEAKTDNLLIEHLVWQKSSEPIVYTLSIPAIEDLIGVSPSQAGVLEPLLKQNAPALRPSGLTIHLEKLHGTLALLSTCVKVQACWEPIPAQQGKLFYQNEGVQLLRYSSAQLTATPSQLANGQLTMLPVGQNGQMSLYRTLLPASMPGLDGIVSLSAQVVPLNAPEYMPIMPAAIHFIPLTVACAINGARCYNGLYIRLSGVETYNQRSLAQLQAVAAQITTRTGLHVDILDGASTRIVTIANGTKSALSALWQVVGVAVQIVHGVDTLQETLLVLCAVICLLAIGAAGVLVGIGHRDESRLLGQLGWPPLQQGAVLVIGALMLLLPGCLLASACVVLCAKFWPGSVPAVLIWGLLLLGVLVFGVALVGIGMTGEQGTLRKGRARSSFYRSFYRKKGAAFPAKVLAPATCAATIAATVFLIAIEYVLVTNFEHELVVTMLGKQVGATLEAPQALLALLLLLTALMTIGLCAMLLLRSRRGEIVLLAQVGWEQRDVLWRILRGMALAAALSGEVGALLAVSMVGLTSAFPSFVSSTVIVAGGPLLGVLLACPITAGLAWRELESVTLWR